jgi:GTPase SAR1 family protein
MENKNFIGEVGRKMKDGEITAEQFEDLEKFLRKCNYDVEELITEREMGLSRKIILNEDWIRNSEKKIKQTIQYLIEKNDLNWVISKIAFDLHIKYDKAISQGQADAVIRRVLGLKLSSTGRSQLHELRKKIQKYKRFLTHFEEWGKQSDYTLKIAVMGLNVGQNDRIFAIFPKTVIPSQRMILGIDFYNKILEIYDKTVILQIWDIIGEEKFKFLRPKFYKGIHGAIIFYDKGSRNSFKLAKEYYLELKKATNLKFKIKGEKGNYADISIILIGLGDSKVVTSEEGQSLAKELGANYYEMLDTDERIFDDALSYLSFQIVKRFQ